MIQQMASADEMKERHGDAARPPYPLLAATTLLYISFGTVLAFVQAGLPPILRARGIDVGNVGLTFLLYLGTMRICVAVPSLG